MALFELFIPAADPNGFNVTARVRADSWMQALRAGLAKLGDTTDVRNVIVDITEQGIDVTEPHSGRVFRIRDLEATAAPSAAAPVAPNSRPAASTAPAVMRPGLTGPVRPTSAAQEAGAAPSGPGSGQVPGAAAPAGSSPSTGPAHSAPSVAAPSGAAPSTGPAHSAPSAAAVRRAPPPVAQGLPPAARAATARTAPSAAAMAAARPSAAPATGAPAAAPPRFVAQVQEETVVRERPVASAAPVVGRGKAASQVSASDDLISDLFAQTQALYDQSDMRAAAGYILDLAMKSVQADSGAVFVADISASDLYFAAARGPKAQEVMKFRVPLGQGIVGFCAQEGVALAVSDVHRDPRFYATISHSLGYETRSILCAPAQVSGRVVGAIELINKRSGTSFTGSEISVLNFLAHEFADYMINTEQTGE